MIARLRALFHHRSAQLAVVHRGADEAYADQLHATGELPVCDELATATEQWLHLHLDLNTIEDQLHTGLGAVLAAAMDALRVNEADLAASYGWAGVRELTEAGA